ncbi:MAG: dynamin family protein [Muribaculum sp.]|nr:dynamin family protein [Muribaculum sp.]
MNYNNISSVDLQHLSFIKDFQELLDNKLEPVSSDVQHAELAAEGLKQKIRDILEKIQALDLLNENISVIDLCEQGVALPLRKYVEQHKKPWLQDKLTIALMGHLKTGKTSAMNCFFGEAFPTSSEEATALATYLYYGENPKSTASLVDKEGGVQEINSEQMQLFSIENSFNFPFARMFSYIAKKSIHPALHDKTFVDTPGLFSSNSEHAASTYKVLDYCDVIFWFIDSRKSISDTEIAFIKESVGDKPIYVIFSFIDARGTQPSGIAAAQDVIKKRLKDEDVEIKGFLQFGKREETQKKFVAEFGKTIKILSENYQTVNPIVSVLQLLQFLQELVQTMIRELTTEMNNEKTELGNLSNGISGAARSVNSAFSSASNSFSSMTSTLNNKCANVTFCTGGAYSTLCSNVNQLASSLQSIANAWENVDYDSIVKFGQLSANIARLDDKISRLDSINKDINEILNIFK